MRVETVTFGTKRQKLAHHTKYLRMYWTQTNFHQIFRVGIEYGYGGTENNGTIQPARPAVG